jgi:hypothetical protein
VDGLQNEKGMNEQASPSVRIRQSEQPWHSSPCANPIEERRRRTRAAIIGSSSAPARMVLGWWCRGIPSLLLPLGKEEEERELNLSSSSSQEAPVGAHSFVSGKIRPFIEAVDVRGTHIPHLDERTGSSSSEVPRLLLSVFWRVREVFLVRRELLHKGARPASTAK